MRLRRRGPGSSWYSWRGTRPTAPSRAATSMPLVAGGGALPPALVYCWCMPRTNIDLDDDACRAVMERYHLGSKREAVNLALRRLAAEPLDLDDARRLRGSGWDGDLEQMRASRAG